MLEHWDRLRWAPETSAGYEVIRKLEESLRIALPYIESPVGHYEQKTPRKASAADVWHIPALAIARIIIEVMIQAGHRDPGITGHSVVARVVCGSAWGLRHDRRRGHT